MITKKIPAEARTDRFAARLYRYVRFNGSCWEFQGATDKDGYATITVAKVRVLAHRASYFMHKGDIPDGALVCHKCDNTRCINPLHLFTGTEKDNAVDAANKGRLATGERNGLNKWRKRGGSRKVNNTGELNPCATLTESSVIWIRTLFQSGLHTYSELAKRFGVTKGAIAHVVTRKTWRHI